MGMPVLDVLGNLIHSPRNVIKARYHTDANDQFCERMSQVATTTALLLMRAVFSCAQGSSAPRRTRSRMNSRERPLTARSLPPVWSHGCRKTQRGDLLYRKARGGQAGSFRVRSLPSQESLQGVLESAPGNAFFHPSWGTGSGCWSGSAVPVRPRSSTTAARAARSAMPPHRLNMSIDASAKAARAEATSARPGA